MLTGKDEHQKEKKIIWGDSNSKGEKDQMSTGNTILNFFNEEFGDVRVLMMDNNPWFVAKDLAKILGYTKLRSMYNIVGDKNKIEINPQTIEITGLPSNGATQLEQNKNVRRMILINESGLYRAIFKSKLNSAEQFQDWVTSEVLPSIRKNGGYID